MIEAVPDDISEDQNRPLRFPDSNGTDNKLIKSILMFFSHDPPLHLARIPTAIVELLSLSSGS